MCLRVCSFVLLIDVCSCASVSVCAIVCLSARLLGGSLVCWLVCLLVANFACCDFVCLEVRFRVRSFVC